MEKTKIRISKRLESIQRTVGWCETVERSHGTRLGASVRTPEYLESRRRRYPPLYGEDIRIIQNIPYPMSV